MTGSEPSGNSALPPSYLAALAAKVAPGTPPLAEPLRPADPAVELRRSAVLLLLAGTSLADSAVLLEERAHTMRSQPGQFALPGGRVEPEDADDRAAALREAQEETGLDPATVQVLGAFAPLPMPWRGYRVRPVVAWTAERPELSALQSAEVERVVWAPLVGPGSLSDPAVRCAGMVTGRETGAAFDLPGDAFVWGFTALMLDALLAELGLVDADRDLTGLPQREVPALRRRAGL